MQNRLKHFRAGLLLALSSGIIFWVISYWLPLPNFLVAVSAEKYAGYQLTIQLFVSLYLVFFILNLVLAGIFFTRLSSTAKFYLALVPAVLLFLVPFLLAIPITTTFPNRNYFEIFMAMYRLFRFTKTELFVTVLILTVLACSLNVLAAIMVRRAGTVDKVSKQFQTRYIIYSAVTLLAVVASVGINTYNAVIRSIDRASCYNYLALQLPELDEDVPIFLNDIQLYGEQAGSAQLRSALITFAMSSRQYYALLDSEADDLTIATYEKAVAAAKLKVTDICSEFSTD